MENQESLLERKSALEVEIFDRQKKKVAVINMVSQLQRQISELDRAELQADGKYRMVCEVLGLDGAVEWEKAFVELKKKDEAAKVVPAEK